MWKHMHLQWRKCEMSKCWSSQLPLRDGLGLSDREMAAESAGSGVGNKQHFGRTESEHTISQGSDVFPASSSKRQAGRPTTSPDKAPYEQPSKRSRLCSICRIQGHKSTTCPARGDVPKAPRKSPRCSKCGLTCHRKKVASICFHSSLSIP